MGANFCKEDDSDRKANEIDLSNKTEILVNKKKPEPKEEMVIQKKELEVIAFDLRMENKNNPVWDENILNSVRIVETQGKEFKEFATSRVNSEGKQKVVLGALGTLVENKEQGEYTITQKNLFMSERLQIKKANTGFYSVNGIHHVKLDGDLTVLCNVDFEDIFPMDLISEIEKLDYSNKIYTKIREKLFNKNFLFR